MFGIESRYLPHIVGAIVFIVHSTGILNAAHAVLNVRSSKGAVAWSISLITFPWLAIPLYWILGRNKFLGYNAVVREAYREHQELIREGLEEIQEFKIVPAERLTEFQSLASALSLIPFTSGNAVKLLIDGKQTFDAMLAAIASAKRYILLQSYIVEDDDTGRFFRDALIARAREGVCVCFLYDEIGSQKLPRHYIDALGKENVQVKAFGTTRGGWRNRFQINFRNHRKILVVDGEQAYVGGLNIGDEYLGRSKNPRLCPWRDTHIQLSGPSVQCLQYCFLQDWYWATRELPDVSFAVKADLKTDAAVFVLPTGPADRQPACTLFYLDVISRAQKRLWIATPYFVPDDSILAALKLAALRGVNVRLLLPGHPDHISPYLCSFSYYDELALAGIDVFRYEPGFMHQKVVLIDEQLAGVGTVNLDNRSFLLNFEVMNFVAHPDFIAAVEQMLEADFERARAVDLSDYGKKPFWFKLAVRVTRLLTPVL